MNTIYTVSAITEVIADTLEKRLPFVWIRGEITNLSRPGSGHIYFNLKDDRSQIQCVWFAHKQRRDAASFDPLTGEVHEDRQPPVSRLLKNGMELLCAGGISIYAARGQYQLLVELVQPAGEGLLAQEFEKLKLRLQAAGYFAQERKRSLPANPCRIALITSPQGAAVHDFLELARARGCGSAVRIYPVPVQGANAAAQIAAMIALANEQAWGQVIVLIRGGGSLEDLWAFNEEILATAIYQSALPVLAGIGHEVDFTLSDMTADLRAATPSHAAQILWPLRREFWQRLDELEQSLYRTMDTRLVQAEKALAAKYNALNWLSPVQKLERMQIRLAAFIDRLNREASLLLDRCATRLGQQIEKCRLAGRTQLTNCDYSLDRLANRLSALNPAAPLKRGYAYLYGKDGPVSSVGGVKPGAAIKAILADGELGLAVTDISRLPEPPFQARNDQN